MYLSIRVITHVHAHCVVCIHLNPQDVSVQSKEFEGSISGLHQYFKCRDSSHGKIVMPEAFVVLERVDAAKRSEQRKPTPSSNQGTSVDPHASEEERRIQIAKEESEEDYLKGALHTQVVDRGEQIRALNEIERRQKLLQNMTDRDHYEPIPGECKLPAHPLNQQPNAQQSSGEQK